LQVAETFNDVEDMQSDIENDDDSILENFNGVPEGEDSGADKPTTMLTFVMMLAAVAAIFS